MKMFSLGMCKLILNVVSLFSQNYSNTLGHCISDTKKDFNEGQIFSILSKVGNNDNHLIFA
jgi:hypothetical protein